MLWLGEINKKGLSLVKFYKYINSIIITLSVIR